MPHYTPLISTIVAGLVLAFVLAAIAQRLRISPLVGYLLAGVLLGPGVPGFFTADQALANELAEIGVILLMFGVGLHFSLSDLLSVRRIALPGAVVQIAAATALGAGLAAWLGWPIGGGLVFGLALSVASTVVLLRALQERRLVETERGRIAVGWLIVEDLAMVLTLVMLPALAPFFKGGAQADASLIALLTPLAITIGKVVAFVAVMLIIGRRVIPWILHAIAHTGSRELFRLSVLAIALGVAFAAAMLFDVSFALGAFFAGVVLSESELSKRAAADSLPLKDAFAVLFFVSVGMLFDPLMLLRTPWELLAVLLVVLMGKALVAYAIVRFFGFRPRIALTVSASLAQIGEFSFILAGLGTALGLLPTQGRDLILASAILSIALNPLAFACVEPLSRWLERRQPSRTDADDRDALFAPLRDHVVLVGYGRVGSVIGSVLEGARVPLAVIEMDAHVTQALRARNVPALCGDAMAKGNLETVGAGRAGLLILAIPDGFEARRVLEIARRLNPRIRTVVRTHSESELKSLQDAGVGLAVLGERELALAMAHYALGHFGSSPRARPTTELQTGDADSKRD
jgi:CPA2 family monovalent cation:H+ antiporter-2